MHREISLNHWFALWDIFYRYERAKRTITPDFLASVDYAAIGELPLYVRTILTYMQNIEGAVWGVYFKELDRAPTGRNPVVAEFLRKWLREENQHAALLKKILEECGGDPPVTVLKPWDSSWIARIIGERLFGGVHMAIGATNELMTLFAYKSFAKLVERDHPELARVLVAIATEESLHYAFYYQMARAYLERSRIAQWFALAVANRFAVGVGIGVRSERDAHWVFYELLRGRREEFLSKVSRNIQKLPGFKGFYAMERLLDRVFAQ